MKPCRLSRSQINRSFLDCKVLIGIHSQIVMLNMKLSHVAVYTWAVLLIQITVIASTIYLSIRVTINTWTWGPRTLETEDPGIRDLRTQGTEDPRIVSCYMIQKLNLC